MKTTRTWRAWAMWAGLFVCLAGYASAAEPQAEAPKAAPTELAKAAAAMKPGEWKELKSPGMNRELMYTASDGKGGSTPNTAYSDRIVWDPVTRRVLFLGAGHGCAYKFIGYSDETNTWSENKNYPDPRMCFAGVKDGVNSLGGHAYNTHTVTDDGVYYWMLHARPWEGDRHLLFRYDIRADKWTTLKVPASYTGAPSECGLTFFKPWNALIQTRSGSNRLSMFDLKTQTWSDIKFEGKIEGIGTGEGAATVSEAHGVVVFGSGAIGWKGDSPLSKVLYQMDAEKKVSQLPVMPVAFRTTTSTLCSDPVTGDILLVTGGEIYSLDLKKPQWIRHEDRKPPFKGGSSSTAISTYGVNMFLSEWTVWLYKHAEAKGLHRGTSSE